MNVLARTSIISLLVLCFSGTATAVTRFGESLCQAPGYSCYKVKQGETWENLFPDINQRAIVMRINRSNVMLRKNMTIAIPQRLDNLDYLSLAPFERQFTAPGNKTVVIDPEQLAWAAYDKNGKLVNWGPISGGKSWCPDVGSACRTVTGTFTVYLEGSNNCKSSKFPIPDGGAPMPYCMFFKGGYAIHASSDVPGYHASHGCVRVFYEDAQWLNREFVETGTTVIIRPYPDN